MELYEILKYKPPFKVKHFKGGIYTVLGFPRDSETCEDYVYYKSENGVEWVRPAIMFSDKVDRVKYPNTTQDTRFEFYNEES